MIKALTAATAAVAILIPGAAVAATGPATRARAYTASAEEIANPGRGFFTYSETHLYAGGDGYLPLIKDDLVAARTGEARTLVFRIFYLERYRGTDTIAAADLNLIRADFATARAAGVKMVVRFAYTATDDADAPVARVLKHIGQLGPILAANADVITAVQAGLIGRWGEWYYTQNFARAEDRRKVLNALLAATPASVPVQVRTPGYKRTLAPSNARVGIHNDCFLAGDDDYGTYTGDDRDWLARQGAATLVGGETCDVSARSGWPTARAEMAAYHWTYLNPSFNTDVLGSWGDEGLAEAARDLGYRIRLTSAVLPATTRPSVRVTAKLTLINEGYAAPYANRPVRLTLTAAGSARQTVTVPADLRTWAPGRPVTLTVSFTAPRQAGAYRLALALPDPSARLASTPAYAIRLANTGLWDAATGANALNATLTVTR
ncbi:DUF4832 domain-containing protein [Actinoplanes sp. NPDC023714]|uniref:DUF4832 domain-containing protein n=1 Tax=Actinoplanes sp. NPDC023714 TaxID=3154322 RepID=UPI0033F998F6